MKKEHIYVDFHILQTFPPSCVNRDDTGSPKTAMYGGVTRARISSQAQKHAMRLMFTEQFDPDQCGVRTKHIVSLVADKIKEIKPELAEKAEEMAIDVLTNAGLDIKSAEAGTNTMFFISHKQVKALAELAAFTSEKIKNNEACKKALGSLPSIDMVLFGRMVVPKKKSNSNSNSDSDLESKLVLSYDACAQVAHSISTHAVQNEYDFFTAVDDMTSSNNGGAGHLSTVEFNSSTQYRYATINVTELVKEPDIDTARAVRGFADAFIRSMPTGKQNSFANRTLPDDVYVTVRRDQPVNLCGAFERPVVGKEGYLAESERRFVEYANKVYGSFTEEPEKSWSIGEGFSTLGESVSLKQLLDELDRWVQENIGEK